MRSRRGGRVVEAGGAFGGLSARVFKAVPNEVANLVLGGSVKEIPICVVAVGDVVIAFAGGGHCLDRWGSMNA